MTLLISGDETLFMETGREVGLDLRSQSYPTKSARGPQMSGYLSVVGDSWAAARMWRHTFPDEPFLGVRVDGQEIWVAFEPRTANDPVSPTILREIRRAFEKAGHV